MSMTKGDVQKKLVAHPHYPQGRVLAAAVSGAFPRVRAALEGEGIAVLPVGPSPALAPPVHCHADLRLHHLGGAEILVEPGGQVLLAQLRALGLAPRFSSRPLGAAYPGDVALNCFLAGGTLFGRLDAADEAILSFCRARGLGLRNVRQGYAKCTCALVGPRAFITADAGLARAAAQSGVDCLRIRPGHVMLPGYDAGFLGGACFLSAPDTLCILGSLGAHPDAAAIGAFCRAHGVHIKALMKGAPLDVGSVIPLLCE